jgi:hypothetical protein
VNKHEAPKETKIFSSCPQLKVKAVYFSGSLSQGSRKRIVDGECGFNVVGITTALCTNL